MVSKSLLSSFIKRLNSSGFYYLALFLVIIGGISFASTVFAVVLPDTTTGLVGHWKLDESPAYNQTTIIDSSSSDINGIFNTDNDLMDKSLTGHIDGAISFDGTEDFINIPNSTVFEPAQNITVSAWVKGGPQLLPSYAYIFSKGADECLNGSYALYTGVSGGISFYITNTDGTYFISPDFGSSIWDDEWHHVVGTYDGSVVRLFVDGSEVEPGTTVTGSTTIKYALTTSNDISVGSYRGTCPAPALNYNGSIDDVRVYDRTLSTLDIQGLYSPTPTINLISPISGHTYYNNEDLYITWTSSGYVGTVDVVLKSIDQEFSPIGSGTSAARAQVIDGSYILPISRSFFPINPGQYRLVLVCENGTVLCNGNADSGYFTMAGPNTPPTISLIGSSTISIEKGVVLVDPGVDISDNEEATSSLVVSTTTDPIGGVNVNIVGVYIVTYTATDTGGLSASTTRTFNIVDTTAPVITIDPYSTTTTDQNITVTATTSEGILDATSHIFTENGSFDFVAVDEYGNTSTSTVTISNINKTPPPTIVPNTVIYGSSSGGRIFTTPVSGPIGTIQDNITPAFYSSTGPESDLGNLSDDGLIVADESELSSSSTDNIENINNPESDLTAAVGSAGIFTSWVWILIAIVVIGGILYFVWRLNNQD
ncbi:MAG: LamG-like jellyroll fold domain-containing protein [Patescibacteria group bacterium]